MLDCLVVGDSIAVGTQQFVEECKLVGRAGINSRQFNKEYPKPLFANNVIISLGTNDHNYVHSFKELMNLRDRVVAEKVYWIMPACNDKFCKQNVNDIIEIIARNLGDHIIKTDRRQADKIHPSYTGYKEIVGKIKNGN